MPTINNPFGEYQKWLQSGNIGSYEEYREPTPPPPPPPPPQPTVTPTTSGTPKPGTDLAVIQQNNPVETDPAKIPDLFPGYKEMTNQLGEVSVKVHSKVLAQRKQLQEAMQPKVNWGSLFGLVGPVGLPAVVKSTVDVENERRITLDTIKQQLDSSEVEENQALWRLNVIYFLPAHMQNPKVNAKTEEAALALHPNPNMTDADRVWFSDMYSKLQHLIPEQMTPAKLRKIIDVSSTQNLPMISVSRASTLELAKYLAKPKAKLPKTLTDADLLKMIDDMQFSDEEKAAYLEIEKISEEGQKQWREIALYTDAIRKGIAQIDTGPLSASETFNLLLTQPGLVANEILEGYRTKVSQPIQGYLMANPSWAPGTSQEELARLEQNLPAKVTELRQFHAKYMAEGMSSWEAYGKAFEESTYPGWYKFFNEVVYDPLNLVLPGYGKLVYARYPFRIIKQLAKFDEFVLQVTDFPLTIAREINRALPVSPTQLALRYGKQASKDIMNFLSSSTMYGTLKGLTAEQISKAMAYTIKVSRERPGDLHDPAVRIGHYLTEHSFVTEKQVKRWAEQITPKQSVTITREMIKEVDDIWHNYWMKMPNYGEEQAADMLIHVLGGTSTDISRTAAKSVLSGREESIMAAAKSLYNTASPDVLIRNAFTHVSTSFIQKTKSDIWRLTSQNKMITDGIVTSWGNRVDKIINWGVINYVDQHLTKPMANHYLYFANYGPFNVIETVMRNVLGGGDFWYPRNADTLSEYYRMFVSNSKADYGLVLAARDAQAVRGEMFIGKDAGKIMLSSVPFINKPVGKFYKNITIAGRKYRFGSAEDFNHFYGDIQTRLRAYAEIREFVSQVQWLYPDEYALIHNAVYKTAQEVLPLSGKTLFDIKSMSRSQITDTLRVHEQTVLGGGPDALAELDVPMSQMESNIAASKVAQELEGKMHIFSPIKNTVIEWARSGFKGDMKVLQANLENRMYEMGLAPLVTKVKLLQNIAKAYISHQPGTSEELYRNLQVLGKMMEGVDAEVHQSRAMVERMVKELTFNEHEAFHATTNEMIMKYLDETQTTMDYLHGITKRQLDGEQFSMDWDGVDFKGFTGYLSPGSGAEKTVDILKGWIDTLPLVMKANLKEIRWENIPARPGHATSGQYNSTTRTITIDPRYFIPTSKDTFLHEMMHGLLVDKLDEHEYKFLLDMADAAGLKGTKQYELIQEAADKNWGWYDYAVQEAKFEYHSQPSEILSWNFGSYTDGIDIPVPMKQFIESHMPTRLTLPEITDTDKIWMHQLNDNNLKQAQLLTYTRNEEFRITEDLLEEKKHIKFATDEDNQAWWKGIFYPRRDVPWKDYDTKKFVLDDEADTIRTHLAKTKEAIPAPPDPFSNLTPDHVAYIFQVTGDNLAAAILNAQMLAVMPRRYFINKVKVQAEKVANHARPGQTAKDIGFTDDQIGYVYDQILQSTGFDPTWVKDNPMVTAVSELRSTFDTLQTIKDTKAMPQGDYDILHEYMQTTIGKLRKNVLFEEAKGAVPVVKGAGIPTAESVRFAEANKEAGTVLPDWNTKKEIAMEAARKEVSKRFTDYSHPNIVDAAMKKIFPFWSYESQRFPWLASTFIRRPAVAANIGKYMDYSDNGYVPIPGQDIQFNPLRGTVFMGGFKRLFQKDYPEYYDAMPGAGFIDAIGRLGFYPGVQYMLPQVILGTIADRRPQWGELMPSWVRTGLDMVTQLNPNSKSVIALTQQIMPDRFRDYMTMLQLANLNQGGVEIWDKLKTDEKLTPEEEKTWADATRQVSGLFGVLSEQGAILRFRPAEYTQYLENSYKVMEEMTGVSVEEQKRISALYPTTGKKLSDYIHLNIAQQKFLHEIEGYERWRNVTSSLSPSSWQEEDRRVRRYYEEIETMYDSARTKGLYDQSGQIISKGIDQLTSDWINGRATAKDWVNGRSELFGSLATASNQLANSLAYRDVPKSLEARAARNLERSSPPPTYAPDEELLYLYYELKPQDRINEETGQMEKDFDTYYAQIDALLTSLQEPYRQIFLDRIQSNWNPMERLYWNISREYIRPYRKVRQLYLDKYNPDQKAIIQRVESSEGTEREALMAQVDPKTGRKIYSQFSEEVRSAREALRQMSPDLDAWLNFWGKTTSFQSPAARSKYEELRKQYLVPAMIGNRK
jgi:hypothetical protein